MRVSKLITLLVLLATLALSPAGVRGAGARAAVSGGGWFLFAGAIPMQFGFAAIQRPDGSAAGSFHHLSG